MLNAKNWLPSEAIQLYRCCVFLGFAVIKKSWKTDRVGGLEVDVLYQINLIRIGRSEISFVVVSLFFLCELYKEFLCVTQDVIVLQVEQFLC